MSTDFKDIIELIKVLAWPIVTVAMLIAFRKTLVRFVRILGQRAMKVSLFDVSVELATIPTPPMPWMDPTIYESSTLTGGEVKTTTLKDLSEKIAENKQWDYLIVDIKTGKFWLISRVFIFSIILQQLGGLRCVVFVETNSKYKRRFIGMATPHEACRALANKYTWLQQALSNSLPSGGLSVLADSLPPESIQEIIHKFIMDGLMRKTFDPNLPDEWTQLSTQSAWEHTRWLNSERISEDLREVFF